MKKLSLATRMYINPFIRIPVKFMVLLTVSKVGMVGCKQSMTISYIYSNGELATPSHDLYICSNCSVASTSTRQ